MSLRLLLDEDTQDEDLVRLLRGRGHDVATVNEMGLRTREDEAILDAALRDERMILTHNFDDFRRINLAHPAHFGIAVICRDADPRNDMSITDITRALDNIEVTGLPLAAGFFIVNHWQY